MRLSGLVGLLETPKTLCVGRDRLGESYRAVEKARKEVDGIKLEHRSVFDLNFPKPCTIYCDPPYAGTTKYKDEFDHDKFYDWCRERKKEGHAVFISEYWMPDDFKCIWEKNVNVSIRPTKTLTQVERLFLYCP